MRRVYPPRGLPESGAWPCGEGQRYAITEDGSVVLLSEVTAFMVKIAMRDGWGYAEGFSGVL